MLCSSIAALLVRARDKSVAGSSNKHRILIVATNISAKPDFSDTERGLTTKGAMQYAVCVGRDPYSEKSGFGLNLI